MNYSSILRKFKNTSRLSPTAWLFFMEAWFWLLIFDLGLRTQPFPRLQAYAARLNHHSTSSLEQSRKLIQLLAKAVDHARNNHIYPMTCLRRALTLQKMLSHRGIATDLKIGVRKDAGQLSAHAWLEYQGKPLREPEKITEVYSTLEKASNL